jgi:hypothetical protein
VALNANLIADLTGLLNAGRKTAHLLPQLDVCRVVWVVVR